MEVQGLAQVHVAHGGISNILEKMKRRNFLKVSSSVLLPILLDGFNVKSFGKSSAIVESLRSAGALANDRVLVIIYLGGGNDGLNTVVPLEYYSEYSKLRSNIAIPENQLLKLAGHPETGLHPAMAGMRSLFDEGKLSIVNSVSYPNPDLSHYRSTDIWMTAVDSSQYSSTGWAGRYLKSQFPGYPESYPTEEMEDPIAVQIGNISSTALLGDDQQSMAVTLKDPEAFYQLIGDSVSDVDPALPCCDAGELISFIRQKQILAVGYASQIKAAADAGKNLAAYPDSSKKNELADQLKVVARLIHGGLKAKIYYVELGGFDTHSEQVGTNPAEGVHASLLAKLSDAVSAFQRDLELQGTADRVIGMTFSDFGRRASSNASRGTDHGVAAPMFVFGNGMKRQMIGVNPNLISGLLPESPIPSNNNRDIKMQVDFRRVYSDILNFWFGLSADKTNNVLFKNFATISLFSNSVETISSGAWLNPEIWSNGRVPDLTDIVQINSGHTVQVGHDIVAKSVNVKLGGELKFLGNYSVNFSR